MIPWTYKHNTPTVKCYHCLIHKLLAMKNRMENDLLSGRGTNSSDRAGNSFSIERSSYRPQFTPCKIVGKRFYSMYLHQEQFFATGFPYIISSRWLHVCPVILMTTSNGVELIVKYAYYTFFRVHHFPYCCSTSVDLYSLYLTLADKGYWYFISKSMYVLSCTICTC